MTFEGRVASIKGLFGLDEKVVVQPGFLRPIDTERIARELDLDESAAHRGRSNSPQTATTQFDEVEQAVVQKIQSEWTWQGGALVGELAAYASRIVQFSINAEFEKLKLLGHDALAKLRGANHRAEAELGPLRERFVSSREELKQFGARHKIVRPARRSSRRWTTFGLMFVLIGFESVVNGFYFATGSEFGLVGGVGTAIGISLVNVVFSFALGLIPARWVHHRNLLLKLLGLIVGGAGLLAIVGLQGFAAHFREATALVGDKAAMSVAVQTLRNSPFAIADLNSFYLAVLGIVFSLLAFWKGYTFDDPYPGYGAATYRADHARDAYTEVHADLFDDLEEIKDTTVAAINAGLDRLPLFPQTAANIRASRAALLENFKGYEASVVTAANQLLSRYRAKNREQRTSPAPAHFDRVWALPHSVLDSAEIATLAADVVEPAINLDRALEELGSLSREVLSEYGELLKSYPHAAHVK
jgi:hypothetical protein